VISRRALRSFWELHPDSEKPLLHWLNTAEAATWSNPADLKFAFNSVDFVGDLTVFDVGGNKYRLITFVHYQRGIVYVKNVLTHKEYDKGAWKQ